MKRIIMAALVAATPSLALAQVGIGAVDPLQPQAPPSTSTTNGFSFGGSLDAEVDLDRNGRRGPIGSYANLYTKMELGLYASLPYGFTVNFIGKYEPADRDPTGSNMYFSNQSAWIDQLYLNWNRGPLDVFVGKIHPRFGFAWDIAPGLYGTDVAEQYELTEKIGAGAQLSISDIFGVSGMIGEHNIRAEFFQADRTAVSGSLFAARWLNPNASSLAGYNIYNWRNQRAFGGADNTQGIGNFVISLAGERVPMPIGTLQYNAGYSQRRAGIDSVDAGTANTEHGYVAGAVWEFPLIWRIEAAPIIEYVRLDNANGVNDQRQEYITAGFSLTRTPWTFAYVYAARRDSDQANGGDSVATQNMASVTVDVSYFANLGIFKGLEFTVGWRNLREGGISSNDYGAQLAWGYKF